VESYAGVTDRPVTYANVAIKTIVLIATAVISAMLSIMYLGNLSWTIVIVAMVVAFISVIAGTRSVRMSPFFALLYSASEGIVLGVISAMYAYFYNGIVPTAILTTGIVFVVMMLLYSTGVIKVTQKFASVLVVALISVIIMSVVMLLFSSFFLTQFYTFYILVSGISAVLSALFLLLDFENIKTCVDAGTDAKYGWVLSLGLMVTLVWIYVEVLRLLAILASRRR